MINRLHLQLCSNIYLILSTETGKICCNNRACVCVSIIHNEWTISILTILCAEVSSALVHVLKTLNIVHNLGINVFLLEENPLYRSNRPRCSVEEVLSENSQISVRVSFLIKLQALTLRTPFSQNTSGHCFRLEVVFYI